MTPFQRPKLTPLKIKKMVIRSAFVHRATDVSSRGLLEREWAKVLLVGGMAPCWSGAQALFPLVGLMLSAALRSFSSCSKGQR